MIRAATAPKLSIDTETNGEDVRDGRGYCQGASLSFMYDGTRMAATYAPFRHKYGFNYGRPILEQFRRVLEFRDDNELPNIYHNSKFDIPSLRTLGVNLKKNVHYCTMLQSHLLKETSFSNSLDAVVKTWIGEGYGKQKSPQLDKIIKTLGWGAVPSELMYWYALTDAGLPYLAHFAMASKWAEEGLDNYWHNHKRKTIEVFIEMEARGVLIDTALCNRMVIRGTSAMQDAAEALDINPASTKDQYELFINRLKLPPQYKKRKNGEKTITFDKTAMAYYDEILERRNDPTAVHVLTYRGWQKTVSSNYRAYVELLSPDGRLRCNYKLHGTRTGRCSCEKPNLQQIPKESVKEWNGGTKLAFIARPGYTLWEADYAQLQFRFAAAYAGEKELIEAFADDSRDVFTEMAAKLSMTRDHTKTLVYTMAFGGGNQRVSDVFGVSMDRAADIRGNYFTTYPKLHSISKLAASTAKSRGRVKLWTGRYRHFLYPDSEAHKAFNAVIQGGEADIMEESMHRLHATVDTPGECEMLLQIHDAIVFEIRDDLADKYIPEIKYQMEAVPQDFGVNFKVDVHPLHKLKRAA